MKQFLGLVVISVLLAACTRGVRTIPVAGTFPADFSWHCAQNFPHGQPISKILSPGELDVRSCDISGWDFTAYTASELADVLTFDSKTRFPPVSKLPKHFSAKKILKQNQNPGLGIRTLHKQGITGQGVSIAILDQNLLLDHEQYADQLRYYWQDPVYQQYDGQASMHGAAVTSILAGKTVGVAPQAHIHYWAENLLVDEQDVLDAGAVAKDLERVLQFNKMLDESEKIRAVSISRGFSKYDKDIALFNQMVKTLSVQGIAVFTTNDVMTLSRSHSLALADGADYCRPAYWFKVQNLPYYAQQTSPLVPTDFRVTAAPNGVQDYVHYAHGGLSWAVPYLTGLYALGVQVQPNLTKEQFLQIITQTATSCLCTYQGVNFTAPALVNPRAFINYLQHANNPV